MWTYCLHLGKCVVLVRSSTRAHSHSTCRALVPTIPIGIPPPTFLSERGFLGQWLPVVHAKYIKAEKSWQPQFVYLSVDIQKTVWYPCDQTAAWPNPRMPIYQRRAGKIWLWSCSLTFYDPTIPIFSQKKWIDSSWRESLATCILGRTTNTWI